MTTKNDNNKLCKSKCIPPYTTVLHPITLTKYTTKDKSICFVNPYISEGIALDVDECTGGEKFDIKSDEFLSSIISPIISFDYETLLRVAYNIVSFEDAIKWVNNNLHLPRRTIDRVLNCAFYIYMDEMKHLMTEITNLLVLYVKTYMKNNIRKMDDSEIRGHVKDSLKLLVDEYKKQMDISYIKKIRKYIKYFITKNI